MLPKYMLSRFIKRNVGKTLTQTSLQFKAFSSKSKCASHSVELEDELYLEQLKGQFHLLYPNENSINLKIKGFATPDHTKNYSKRKTDIVNEKHFRKTYHDELTLSSIGIGSYIGKPDQDDDLKLFNAVIDSVRTGGVNVIDTAINYRYMKSERSIGAALQYLVNVEGYKREELFISSKNGYISEDFDKKIVADEYIARMIKEGKITAGDIAGECHCMHPNFLSDQLDRSLENLGLETLDLMYLHNAAESQLPLIGEEEFFKRLAKVFEFYEKKIQENKIRSYGLATWVSYRAKPEEKNLHVSLEKTLDLAEKVAGKNHGLKYIQLPINIMMPEAFAENWQIVKSNDQGEENAEVPFLTSARLNKINVFSSSPLLQGSVIQVPLPTEVFKCSYLGAKHLQFVRSIPAEALISTLVGMKRSRHVKTNLEVIQHAPLSDEEFWNFLIPPSVREQSPEAEVDN